MLCERCHENVNPVVVFDVDGTLARYHDACYRFVQQYWGLSNGSVCNWDGSGDLEDYIGVTKEQYRQAKLAFRQGGQKRFMAAYWEVLSSSRTLSTRADLWIVTNRPWLRLDNVDQDTCFWLEKHGVPYKGLLFGDDKYGDLLEIVDRERIVAVIEDLPEQYDRAMELRLPVWQVSRQHNSAPSQERPTRASIAYIHQAVTVDIDRWQKQEDRNGN